MSDLKHACHECGGRIGYPEHAFGQIVACPHCSKETSLGEVYTTTPPPAYTTAPPPPAKLRLSIRPSEPSTPPPAAAKASFSVPKRKGKVDTSKNSAGGVWGSLGSLLVLCWLLFQFGGPIYDGYLQTDTAAINLIKQSMLESFNKAPDIKKPVEILQMSLDEGPDKNRTGSAVVSAGGEAETIRFKVKIVRSFEKGLSVEWQLVE